MTGRALILSLFFIPLIFLLMEGLFRLIPVPAPVFVPTIDRELNYPEIDIKLSRLSILEQDNDVNCFILGSSMADFGIDPKALNRLSSMRGTKDPVCFNMALKAMKPELSARIAGILIQQSRPSILIMGISPVDFTGGQDVIRKFVHSPWLRFHEGQYSLEGWLIENSFDYRYWLSFLKYRDPAYRTDLKNQLAMIDAFGFQMEEKTIYTYRVNLDVELPDFQFLENDLDGLKKITGLNSPDLHVVVVEMPVHPDFLPHYIGGGETGYEEDFIQPVEELLKTEKIPFIRSQSRVQDIVAPDGWKDYLHLNQSGAEQFSRWLAEELVVPH